MRGVAARQRLLAGLPVSERNMSVAGSSTALLEGGEGPPLILLHGGIECGGAYWAPVIASLARSHRLVVPDVPGLGESEPLPRLNAASFCEWFEALLSETTSSEKPMLVAHSLTGSLAARFAATTTGQLQSLFLYAVPGIGPFRMPIGLMVASIRFGLRPSEANFERFLPWPFLEAGRTREREPEWFDAFSAYMVSQGSVPHVKRTMRQVMAAGKKRVGDAELRRIDVPTALLWGERDRMTPLSLANDTSGRLDWPLHVVHEAGHVPHIEQPRAFVEALREGDGGSPSITAD
jgi:pimeloyl-ACP methyl ester carboxylesterase